MMNHSKTYTDATLPSFHEAIATGLVNLSDPSYLKLIQNWPWLTRKIHSTACQCDWVSQYTTLETTLHLLDAHVNGQPSVKKRLGAWSEKRFLDWLEGLSEPDAVTGRNRVSAPRKSQSKSNLGVGRA